MDKIKIDDIKIFGHHGVLPEEKKNGQYCFVSAELGLDLKKAGVSDKLAETVNYAEVTDLIRKEFTSTNYDTIEAAAEKLVEAILNGFTQIESVTVKVRKPDAPIDADFRDVSVEIGRSRHKVYLGLGSNLGDKKEYLETAIPGLKPRRASSVTASAGCR